MEVLRRSGVCDLTKGRGRATPTAGSERLAPGRGAERSRKRLPSCSTSVSVSESRSAITAGQEARAPLSAAARRSSSLSRDSFAVSARIWSANHTEFNTAVERSTKAATTVSAATSFVAAPTGSERFEGSSRRFASVSALLLNGVDATRDLSAKLQGAFASLLQCDSRVRAYRRSR